MVVCTFQEFANFIQVIKCYEIIHNIFFFNIIMPVGSVVMSFPSLLILLTVTSVFNIFQYHINIFGSVFLCGLRWMSNQLLLGGVFHKCQLDPVFNVESSLSLAIFCKLVLPFIVFMDLAISSFSFTSFCFMYFKAHN